MKNYYKILGIKTSATEAEIKQAYRALAKALHPDLNRDNPNAEEQIADINEAYAVLSDKAKRNEYNTQLNQVIMQRNGVRPPTSSPHQRTAFNNAHNMKSNPYANNFQNVYGHPNEDDLGRQAIEASLKQAFNEGYTKGYSDLQARAEDTANKLKAEIASLTRQLKAALKDTEEADREAEQQAQKIIELIASNDRLKSQIAALSDAGKISDTAKQNEQTLFELNVANTHLERTKQKLKQAEDSLFIKDGQISELYEENKELKEKVIGYEDYIGTLDQNETVERFIAQREVKLKEDKKALKNTYYGTLGVLYWANEEDIQFNYNKLKTRYLNKLENGDEKAREKLEEIEKAYAVLRDEKKRTEYNKETLEITYSDIERELQLEANYNKIIENYEQSKAEQDFWKYIDELTLLAQSGDAEAQNTLGELYFYGDELEQDLEQAVYWFKEAAKQQNTQAMYNLGQCLYNGEGIAEDKIRGEGFIKQAAKLGNHDAAKFFK